ncbi:MAG: hypothetical protein ACU4F9_06065 [Arcticibacter sp.]
MSIHISDGLIKIIGVFGFNNKKDYKRFIDSGYTTIHVVDLPTGYEAVERAIEETKQFYKDTYYSEFRELMFSGVENRERVGLQQKSIIKLIRNVAFQGSFITNQFDNQTKSMKERLVPFEVISQELFLFPDGIGMFALSFDLKNKDIHYASDLINQARSFYSKINTDETQKRCFHEWITLKQLCGIKLVGENLKVDDYSGSKFKVYSVFDLPNKFDTYNRDDLLYELGTSSPIGTVSGNTRHKPSKFYFDELMNNKLGVFENYEALALLDSFTVIGNQNYAGIENMQAGFIPHHQWNRVYFAIYIFNLYVRYNLFKFNSEFLSNPVRYRSEFQTFLNQYNFTHVSFNFLPNIIFRKMREAMGIDFEIDKFEKRLINLASTIQENQEKRQAFLLTLISVLSGWEAAGHLINQTNSLKQWLGWSEPSFYSLIFSLIFVLGIILIEYLFPIHAQKARKKIIKIWDKYVKRKMQ